MKYRVRLLVIIMVLVAVGLTACQGSTVPFESTAWVLESYGEPGDPQAVIEGTEITATFSRAERQVEGSAGCNHYFGDYTVNRSKLSIPVVASTEMYCMEPEGVMEQEQQYLQALQSAESYEIRDGKLRISSSDGNVLVFRAR